MNECNGMCVPCTGRCKTKRNSQNQIYSNELNYNSQQNQDYNKLNKKYE